MPNGVAKCSRSAWLFGGFLVPLIGHASEVDAGISHVWKKYALSLALLLCMPFWKVHER